MDLDGRSQRSCGVVRMVLTMMTGAVVDDDHGVF